MKRKRYSRAFYEALKFLDQSEKWPLTDQLAYQDEQLQQLILYAYQTVPYYREQFDRLRLSPADVRKVADLPKLPILEKATIRERSGDLLSRAWPRKRCEVGYTGGTTGTALKLVRDKDTQAWQWAVWWRHRQRFGLKLDDEFIVFAGRSVVPTTDMKPPFWRRNWPMRQTYVSVHHLTRQNMPVLAEYLKSRRVTFYSGYPSALYLVASYLLDNNIQLPYPPKVVTTGAETVLPHQRRVIELGFQSEVADQYGASEHCGNISECEHHSYHIDMEFGVVEIVPVTGLPANAGRIICTGFRNLAMPLIRYNIGDIATLKGGECACGRKAPMVERIDGRIESYIQTPDGRQLGRLDFVFKATDRIIEAQLVQQELESVVVKIVPAPGYGPRDELSLLCDLRKYLGEKIRLQLEYVREVPREANGKFRQIVSSMIRDRHGPTQYPVDTRGAQ